MFLLLLQHYKLALVNLCSLEFQHLKTCNFYDESEGDWHLKYALELRVFLFN